MEVCCQEHSTVNRLGEGPIAEVMRSMSASDAALVSPDHDRPRFPGPLFA